MKEDTPLTTLFQLTHRQKEGLKRIGIHTTNDLLYHFPNRYENYARVKKISELQEGNSVTIIGKLTMVSMTKAWRKKTPMARGTLEDNTGNIGLLWFNKAYAAKTLPLNTTISISGNVRKRKNGKLWILNPLWQLNAENAPGIVATYPRTKGVSSSWFQSKIEKILENPALLPKEYISLELLKKYNLPTLPRAFFYIHRPHEQKFAEAARKRFAFEEIFLLQLSRLLQRKLIAQQKALTISPQKNILEEFVQNLDFSLTNAQEKALEEIFSKLEKPVPMSMLLQGDVGSGKTLVALIAALMSVRCGYQTIYMAPTEILAQQIFQEFKNRLASFDIPLGLLTSSFAHKFPSKVSYEPHAKVSKNRLLKWLSEGHIKILIGTHALFQERVKYNNVALVIIDEQHRFGIQQRAALSQKQTAVPHLLSMTATPIPRTLALTVYGDLDIATLDELPQIRNVKNRIVVPKERPALYEFLERKLKEGNQLFVICPRIKPRAYKDRADRLKFDMKTVTQEYEKLKIIFSEFSIGMLHGQMLPKEKTKIVEDFKKGDMHVLISTSVVEVGMDVSKANLMLIEGAERFGLAQLHQFRGRIGRRGEEAYCFFALTRPSPTALRRLKALMEARDGFELSEYDLQFRGAGELSGKTQWGVSDIGMEALKNIRLVEAARAEAEKIIETDPELKNFPKLKEKLEESELEKLHLE